MNGLGNIPGLWSIITQSHWTLCVDVESHTVIGDISWYFGPLAHHRSVLCIFLCAHTSQRYDGVGFKPICSSVNTRITTLLVFASAYQPPCSFPQYTQRLINSSLSVSRISKPAVDQYRCCCKETESQTLHTHVWTGEKISTGSTVSRRAL